MLGYFIVPHDRRNYVVIAAVEHFRLFYLVFYSLNEMLDFVKMFPANGGGGMGVCMSLSEFQNRSFGALRRKPCPVGISVVYALIWLLSFVAISS